MTSYMCTMAILEVGAVAERGEERGVEALICGA